MMWCWVIFSRLICHQYRFSDGMSRSSFYFWSGCVFFPSLSFKISLDMLDKPLISCVFFSCGLSSLPLDIVFPREPVFNSVKFSLSRISFTNHVFGAIWKNASPYSRSSRSSPMLSSRSFAVLHSTLRSTIDFNFGEGIRCASRSLFGSGLFGVFCVSMPIVPASLTLSLLHCVAFAALSEMSWMRLCGSVPDLCVLFHYLSSFPPRHTPLISVSQWLGLEVRQCKPFNSVLLLQYCVEYSGYFAFYLRLTLPG